MKRLRSRFPTISGMHRYIVAVLSCLLVPTLAFSKVEKTIHLTTLEWKPYSGETLVNGGYSSAIVRAAFKAMGYKLEVDYYPWNRAIQYALKEPGYYGYYPEYFSDTVERNFLYSDKFGTSRLGFMVRADRKINWNKLYDLKDYTIGIVEGYVNTQEFDEMVESGQLTVEKTKDDLSNIRKIGEGRIDLAIIDENVLEYLLNNELSLSKYRDTVVFQKVLEDQDLYVCFRKSPEGHHARDIFNKGLKKIDPQKIIQDIKHTQNSKKAQ